MNQRGRPLVLLVVLAGLLAGPTSAGAQSEADRQRQIESQIEALKNQVSEASAEEAKLILELDKSLGTKRSLDAKVASLDGEIAGVQRNLNAALNKLAAAQAEQRAAEARLAAAQAALAEARAKLAAYAVAAYTGQSDALRFLTTTFTAQSMDELVTKRSYLKVVGNNQAEVIALDERLRDEVKDLSLELKQAASQAEAQANVVEGQRAELQKSRDAQEAVRSEVAAQVAHTEELRAEVVARKDEFLAEEEALEAESASIEAQLRARAEEQRRAAAAAAAASTTTTTPAGTSGGGSSGGSGGAGTTGTATSIAPAVGGFIRPVSGPITSSFGYRVHPIYGTTRMHTGVDIGADSGTPIRASNAGVVVTAGWMDGYGNVTIIDHGGGVATLYGHQSSFAVSGGERVTQGQTIGRVGCTGTCTGPHLHFEVRENGTPVDPMRYIG